VGPGGGVAGPGGGGAGNGFEVEDATSCVMGRGLRGGVVGPGLGTGGPGGPGGPGCGLLITGPVTAYEGVVAYPAMTAKTRSITTPTSILRVIDSPL